jgi:hypothetical protein
VTATETLANLIARQADISNRAAYLAGHNDGIAAVYRPNGYTGARRAEYERGYDDGIDVRTHIAGAR